MTPFELDTARLRLRVWQPRHLAPYAALNRDPEVMRHFPAPLSEAQTRAMVGRWQDQFAQQGWSNWAVEPADDGTCIGHIGLTVPRHTLPCSPCVEIGWRLARAHWGRGYAAEGARACLALAFERLGLDEVVSFTALSNLRSRAVMVRIGMVDSGQDFDHPALPEGHALRRHCLYRIGRARWRGQVAP